MDVVAAVKRGYTLFGLHTGIYMMEPVEQVAWVLVFLAILMAMMYAFPYNLVLQGVVALLSLSDAAPDAPVEQGSAIRAEGGL